MTPRGAPLPPHAELAAPDTAAPTQGRGASGARIAAINVFRGFAILEVVLHHTSGIALRLASEGSFTHTFLAILNRTLHFAVPAFLFMTAVVLTRSALREFRLGKYYWGRVRKSLVPYVLWTAIYAVFKVLTGANPPEVLLNPERWIFWLQYGKAYFHLYFLLIALQFYLVLPLLLPLFRRTWPLWLVVTVAFGTQLGVYWLNRSTDLVHFRFPGTMALWYIPAITLGMYVGANYARFDELWRRHRRPVFAFAALGWAVYLPLAYTVLTGGRVNTFVYSAAHWVYTTVFALVLFGVAHSAARGPAWLSRPLARLGTFSLQIYLLHPAVLFWVDRRGAFPGGDSALFLLTVLGYALVALLVPFVIARALEGRRASVWLFGR
ncbi:acyltransferase [Deinococcus pimensis]|uniref:acyltransferase n=1 Tax=Deinococcus pimensis TaxID=309888 RepID=UPI0004AF4D1E|nr:acyltransferase [Deinococcus pimensis]